MDRTDGGQPPSETMALFQSLVHTDALRTALLEAAGASTPLKDLQAKLGSSLAGSESLKKLAGDLYGSSGTSMAAQIASQFPVSALGEILPGSALGKFSPRSAIAEMMPSQATTGSAINAMLLANKEQMDRLAAAIRPQFPNFALAVLQGSAAHVLDIQLGQSDALERVRRAANLTVEMPTATGFEQLADLVEMGEIDIDIVNTAEDTIDAIEPVSEAVTVAAATLAEWHPLMSREDARRLICLFVWLAWAGTLFTLAVVSGLPPAVGAVFGASGLAHKDVTEAVGRAFDRRYPAERYPPEVDGEPQAE